MEKVEWIFGAVGNVVGQRVGKDGKVYYGSKAFTPKTKVYINGKYFDKDTKWLEVIGRNRFGRMVVDFLPIELIENVRTQRIYSPKVLEIIEMLCIVDGDDWWGKTAKDKKGAENFVKTIISEKN